MGRRGANGEQSITRRSAAISVAFALIGFVIPAGAIRAQAFATPEQALPARGTWSGTIQVEPTVTFDLAGFPPLSPDFGTVSGSTIISVSNAGGASDGTIDLDSNSVLTYQHYAEERSSRGTYCTPQASLVLGPASGSLSVASVTATAGLELGFGATSDDTASSQLSIVDRPCVPEGASWKEYVRFPQRDWLYGPLTWCTTARFGYVIPTQALQVVNEFRDGDWVQILVMRGAFSSACTHPATVGGIKITLDLEFAGGPPPTPQDTDGDGVPDATDNCVHDINPDQLDSDVPPDGVGDACKWDPLVKKAWNRYQQAIALEPPETLGFYYQILNIVCASANSSDAEKCRQMMPYHASGWSDDWVYGVFHGYFTDNGGAAGDPANIRDTITQAAGPLFENLAVLCGNPPSWLKPLLGPVPAFALWGCHELSGDFGALGPGAPHFANQLDPQFKKQTASRLASATADTAPGVLCDIRAQHEALFANAVAPGFDQVHAAHYMSAAGRVAAKKLVPIGAAFFRDKNFEELLVDKFGSSDGRAIYHDYWSLCGGGSIVGTLAVRTDVDTPGDIVHVVIDADTFLIGTLADLVFSSDPVMVGQVPVTADGGLDTSASIPLDAPCGSHRLHFRGIAPNRDPIEVIQPVTVLNVPPSPQGLVATLVGRSIQVSWEQNEEQCPISSYLVSWTSSAGSGTEFVEGDTTNFDFKDLPAGTYAITVTATNDAGESPPAGPVSQKVAASVPEAPQSVTASPLNKGAKVSFVAPASDGGATVTSYTATCGTKSKSGALSPISVGSLVNGTTAKCSVQATNVAGQGPATILVSVRVGAPTAPSSISVKPGLTRGTLRVSWGTSVANAAPITGYVVTCAPTVTGVSAKTIVTTVRSATFTGLSRLRLYRCKAAAKNRLGTGPYRTASTAVRPHT